MYQHAYIYSVCSDDVTADGTVQRRFCPVKNKIQFTNILFIVSKNCLILLFIYINRLLGNDAYMRHPRECR